MITMSNTFRKGTPSGFMFCKSHLLILVLTWRSAVSAVQLGLDEVRDISVCSAEVDTCEGRITSLDIYEYAGSRCSCDADCHLFGECCVDRAVLADTPSSSADSGSSTQVTLTDEEHSHDVPGNTSDVRGEIQETTEVYGIPSDRWGCQNLVVTTTTFLPVKRVRMVVRCPADARPELSDKCAALNRSSSDFHYTMDIPMLSSASGIWYQNVYCAICNEDADKLVRLMYSLECDRNYTKEETLQILREGQYSTEPLQWILWEPEENRCRLMTELQPGISPGFLRPCGKVDSKNQNLLLIEDCPPDWMDHTVAKKCRAYAFYSNMRSNDAGMIIGPSDNDKSAVLSAVFKNPHCALCNGVPLQNTTCWLKSRLRTISKARGHVPSFSIIMDFTFWEDENQELRSCELPDGFWDVLHKTCIQVQNDDLDARANSSRMLNLTCPVVTLTHSEFQILSNGSVQYTGSNLDYLGHVFDDFEITENHSAIVCALQHDKGNEDLISGAYQGYLTEFCLSISIICLVLHIATYCALPKLCNLPGKNLLSLSWALLFAQLLFLVGINPIFEVPLGVCIGIAVVEHYCFLAAFFWMNVMSVDIWRTFSRSTLRGNGGMKTHCKFAGYAWGSSAFIAFVAMSVDFCTEDGAVKPSFGTGQVCWFGNRGGLGLFLAMPLFVILMVNSGLFANTVYKIWQAQLQGKRYIRDRTRDELIQSSCNSTNMKATIHKRKDDSGITSRKDKIRFYLYLKLFTIMGLTWIFGFIAAFAHVTFLWYPFIVFNGLQGTFIFVMFDMKRNIACMLWDKYVSQHGYQPPRFLLATSSSSTTRSTVSSKIKSRDSASGSDKTHSTATTRTISTASDPHLTLTIT